MMKLSFMKEIFEDINQEWDCPISGQFMEKWSPGHDWAKIIRASSNAVGMAGCGSETLIIRYNHQKERSIKEWQQELRIQRMLSRAGVPVVGPLKSRNGEWVEQLESRHGPLLGCSFTQAQGEHLEMEDLSLKHYFHWGKTLGSFHRASADLPRDIKRKDQLQWLDQLLKEAPAKSADEMDEVVWIKDRLSSLPKNSKNYGLIHYDFELDNLFWSGDEIEIIDLDDCLYSWYAADIAYALRDLFNQGYRINFNLPEAQEFLRGYQREFALEPPWLDRMEEFYRIHHYFSYKRIERALDIEKTPDNPDWLNDLVDNLKHMQSSCKRF